MGLDTKCHWCHRGVQQSLFIKLLDPKSSMTPCCIRVQCLKPMGCVCLKIHITVYIFVLFTEGVFWSHRLSFCGKATKSIKRNIPKEWNPYITQMEAVGALFKLPKLCLKVLVWFPEALRVVSSEVTRLLQIFYLSAEESIRTEKALHLRTLTDYEVIFCILVLRPW